MHFLQLSSAQLARLDEFNARYDTDWGVNTEETGTHPETKAELIEVKVRPYAMQSFERYIDTDGNLYLYDGDTDKFVEGKVDPEIGSYQTREPNGSLRTRTYTY